MGDSTEGWAEEFLDVASSADDCLTPSTTDTMSEEDPTRENGSETPSEDTPQVEVNNSPPEDSPQGSNEATPESDPTDLENKPLQEDAPGNSENNTTKERAPEEAEENTTQEHAPEEKEIKSTQETNKEKGTETHICNSSKGERSKMAQNTPMDHIECPPIAGKSFMIRTRNEPRRILTLKGGQLEFLEKPIPGGGAFWHCHEMDNWYGFCNTVSGTYLGHNGESKVVATNDRHEITEYFVTRREESGGYILLIPHEHALLQVAISEDGKSLVEQKEGGEAWDFIDVKHVHHSVSIVFPNTPIQRLR
ncbi:hypothetical protein V8C35DRAFT_114738 [Trichoderma chlorosporum]